MKEYIPLMHDDATDKAAADSGEGWESYLASLRRSGRFDGGSSIGRGESLNRNRRPQNASLEITGFLRVRANSLEDAKRFLSGNPVYEAGGTVQVRELPED